MTCSNLIARALVIGGLGQVGRLLSESMRKSGITVAIADVRSVAPSASSDGESPYVNCDVRSASLELIREIQSSDCVCLCLPEEVTIQGVASVVRYMPAGSLWVDTLSVKTGIASELQKHLGRNEMLSINPMFAPALGWKEHAVAVVELSSGPKARDFCRLLQSWGAHVELVSAVEHDQLTAGIQLATHASVLAFGHALTAMNFDMAKAVRMSTPPHRLLLALLHRMMGQNPEVYWDIQAWHPLGGVVREKLAEGIARLNDASGTDGQQRFESLFDDIRNLLASGGNSPGEWSQRLFARLDP